MSAAANSYSTLLQLIMTSLGSSWDAVGMASMYVRCSPPSLIFSGYIVFIVVFTTAADTCIIHCHPGCIHFLGPLPILGWVSRAGFNNTGENAE